MRFIFGALFFCLATAKLFSREPQKKTDATFPPLTARDRLLVLAPHPDDESLGAGGLIQKALAAHAKVRIVFATNGEASRWSQRFFEGRLFISTKDEARFGERRKAEALRAITSLGIAPRDAIFLDLPDQGLTRLLLEKNSEAMKKFREAIGGFHPTMAAIPSRYDLHPDHNACFVFARLVLGPPTPRLTELEYLVHKTPLADTRGTLAIELTPREQTKKRNAILAHASQMTLSRRSLTGFAKREEVFFAPAPPRETDANHPARKAALRNGGLTLHFADRKTEREYRNTPRLLVSGHGQTFLKLEKRAFFLDRSGWREVPSR